MYMVYYIVIYDILYYYMMLVNMPTIPFALQPIFELFSFLICSNWVAI